MSMWDEVFETLRSMSLWQLLFAFVACTAYAVAQGRLVGSRAKWTAFGVAAVSTSAFLVDSGRWVDGFILIAVGLACMGVFAAFVWTVSRVLGMTGVEAPLAVDSPLSVAPQDVGGPEAPQPRAPQPRPAPSH